LLERIELYCFQHLTRLFLVALCYHAAMTRLPAVVGAVVLATVVVSATREDLARARALFNERKYDEAIAAAEAARKTPETADAAAIVVARAHLERYRGLADPADLGAARAALGSTNPEKLGTPDRAEYLIALGGSLFLEDDFGAAAEIFESAIEIAPAAGEGAREAVLDWYGSAMERWASPYRTSTRAPMLARLITTMEREQAKNPSSRAASYWLVAGLRAQGELERAWQAAIAAWVRAPIAGPRGVALRADVDRLVREGLIPDRGKEVSESERAERESRLRAEWELLKERWK
jgi:tetratricopeptide (TPR) repeat protein